MFFTNERLQFFRPLTSKYREQIVECLRLLHERLYSARADYGESLKREQVLDIFSEALERAPLLESEDEDASRFKSNREQASWILTSLIENGWLERQVDQATFQSTYPFSRSGRLFTQTLAEVDGRSVRTSCWWFGAPAAAFLHPLSKHTRSVHTRKTQRLGEHSSRYVGNSHVQAHGTLG